MYAFTAKKIGPPTLTLPLEGGGMGRGGPLSSRSCYRRIDADVRGRVRASGE